MFRAQCIDPLHIGWTFVVTALNANHHDLATNAPFDADVNFALIPGNAVSKHLRFGNRRPSSEICPYKVYELLEFVCSLWHEGRYFEKLMGLGADYS